jgi:phosphatidylserine/phosphatidylglycerophosphate/cardiolipin synthase-like enzyme
MNYQRVLVVVELGADPRAEIAAVQRFAPSAVHATVLAQQPRRPVAWLGLASPAGGGEAWQRALAELRTEAARAAARVEVAFVSELTMGLLSEAVTGRGIDLVVVGSLPARTLALAAELPKRSAVAVLVARPALPEQPAPHGGNRLLCVGLSARGRSAVVKFLREHAAATDRAVLLSSAPLSPKELDDLREVAGLAPELRLSDGWSQPWWRLLIEETGPSIDLVVLPRVPPVALLVLSALPPLLLLPPVASQAGEWQLAIDVPDLVDDGALIRARVEYAVGVGRRTPIADQELAFVREGQVVAWIVSRRGEAELPSGLGSSLGVFRSQGRRGGDPAERVEVSVAVLRAGTRPLLLFDADLERADLLRLRGAAGAEPVGVRLRPLRSCASLRARVRAGGLTPCVLDARAVLGEGDAVDVPAQADAVRLARVAARMRADGFPIAAIVFRGDHRPEARGFVAVRPVELAALHPAPPVAHRCASLGERLDATTGSDASPGNRVEVELENRVARERLLAAIAGSRRSLHVQAYMAADDEVGRAVEAALAAAAARGVEVRVLIDSLHGLHGSLGTRNPILERLGALPGIELRVSQPITSLPSLEELKQRDHRKLVVADGRVALVGGRNLSHEYYTGFEEVRLTRDAHWRAVPWLEAGARIEGPAVAVLERSFLQAWTEAGGAPFAVRVPAPAGTTSARVIVHRGLRDAYALEAYLALIETAESHLTVVNGFPLLLEIQHALLRALRRGVRVRTLFGNLAPKHGNEPFPGLWETARSTATSFVHSRMDALVAEGADCHELIVRAQPAWEPSLGDVRPHVHAKAMSADGRVCALGSANLDITGGYWESELLLVLEDPTLAAAFEARVEALMDGSARVDRNDPEWRRRAESREWMHYWPGTLSF